MFKVLQRRDCASVARVATVVSAVTALLAIGSAAYAVSRDSGPATTVHACYSHPGGRLRLGTICRKNENPVTWSVAGPPGAAGPPGPPGPQGEPGLSGARGASGATSTVIVTDTVSIVHHSVFAGGPPPPTSLTATATCPEGR